jgi:hypothetical protein
MDEDTKFMYRWVPLAGALGRMIDRLIAYLADSTAQKVSFATYVVAHFWEAIANMVIAAGITLAAAIFLDLNRQNRGRILASAFVLGALWPAAWDRILGLGRDLVGTIH